METRIAVITIIIEDRSVAGNVNAVLSEYAEYIIGRMGLPYRKRNINIITLALDAPETKISALSGTLGNLEGVTTKTTFAPMTYNDEER